MTVAVSDYQHTDRRMALSISEGTHGHGICVSRYGLVSSCRRDLWHQNEDPDMPRPVEMIGVRCGQTQHGGVGNLLIRLEVPETDIAVTGNCHPTLTGFCRGLWSGPPRTGPQEISDQ